MTTSTPDTGRELRTLVTAQGTLEVSLEEVPVPEPGPDEVAIGVAGAAEAGPPGLNAGGGGELHAVRPEQIRAAQIRDARVAVVADTRAARVAMMAGGGRRFMRLTSARTGGARR